MQEKKAAFKCPPKKYQPRGLTVLYEDHDILVVDKINGLLTVSTNSEKEKTAFVLLNDYVKKGSARSHNRVFVVHRLDRETSGILVFAKSAEAQQYLQEDWQNCTKTYQAVVYGNLEQKEGTITSYLAENKAYRVYTTTDQKVGKLSKTGYKVIRESAHFSLVEVYLYTGRKNQIRVHFADMDHPVAGDKVYGPKDKQIKRLALHAASLTIQHPFSKEKMTFNSEVPSYFRTILKF